jgi:hypothetical protein
MFHVQTPYLVSSPFGLPHSLFLHAADHTTLELASTQTNNVKLHDCEAKSDFWDNQKQITAISKTKTI